MSTPALSPRPRKTSLSHAPPSRKARPSVNRSPNIVPAPLASLRTNEIQTPSNVIGKEPKPHSPNYFALAVDANANSNTDVFAPSVPQPIRGHWSPPPNVRSTALASPRIIPINQNPEFEQFRRQSENGRAFSLSKFGFGSSQSSFSTPKSSVLGPMNPPASPPSMTCPATANDKANCQNSGSDSPEKPRSPKRLLSSETAALTDRPRRNSPASFLDQDGYGRTSELAEFLGERNSQSLLSRKSAHPASYRSDHRAETLPATFAGDNGTDGPSIISPQRLVNMLESAGEGVLLLDLRVSTQYAKACIANALNLCIPTTLLKRPSFNVQKLAETFKDDEQRQKFESWRNSQHIIVYDASSSRLNDATICLNTLKKFTAQGRNGGLYIARGGFEEFAEKFPAWITHGSTEAPTSTSAQVESDRPSVAPVIGGCPMPTTQNAANPFFGNIRQNMDLIGGVGQMPVEHPKEMTQQAEEKLPGWLQKASNEKNKGKLVADKFLQIEKHEQRRMQEALSGQVVYGTPASGPNGPKAIKIAGIEKGSKNRYNSIWPYEHSRVKLQGIGEGGCDYVNANYIQSPFSNKRYIATQGPLPATFNDFWNVVWQQDVRVIVMLTAEQEGGQLKAHNYWASRQYGHLQLDLLEERRVSLDPLKIYRHREQRKPTQGQRRLSNPTTSAYFPKEATASPATSDQPYVTIRTFSLLNSEDAFERMREITQLQYSHWPDFGAPADPKTLLGLIEQCDIVCRQVNGGSPSRPAPPNTRPVLVHCSAGCGRTGTFCTVASVIDIIKRQRQVRNARQSMPLEPDPLPPSGKPQESPTNGDEEQPQIKPLKKGEGSSLERKNEREEDSWLTAEDLDLIEKTVADFRLQRLSMVQCLRQFVLCYESVLEWLLEQYPRSA